MKKLAVKIGRLCAKAVVEFLKTVSLLQGGASAKWDGDTKERVKRAKTI